MRKITQESINAFNNDKSFKKANMEVTVDDNETALYLHGNKIAKKIKDELFISNAGWYSNTTKERLNGLDNVWINQVNYQWFLNGEPWKNAGGWTKVS